MRCPFKENEEIVCIKENFFCYVTSDKFSTTNTFTLYDDAPSKSKLTPYKTYKVVEIPIKLYDNIGIINDIGNYMIPNWNHFITIKEYRKRKLQKINKY